MALALVTTISISSCQTQDLALLNNGPTYIQNDGKVRTTRSNITGTRTVFEKVQEIICDHVNISPSQIQLGSIIRNDLGLDSLDFIEIIISVEEEFGISVPDEAIDDLITIEDLVFHINTNLSSHPEIFSKLVQTLENQINISKGQVDTYSNLNTDLGMDSLDLVELIIAVEDEFDVEIPNEAIENIVTVENLVDYIASQTESNTPIDPPDIPITPDPDPEQPVLVDIEDWIKETLSIKTGFPESMLTPSTRLTDDLGMDEWDIIDFKLEVESHFGILISDVSLERMLTIGDWITYLKNRSFDRPFGRPLVPSSSN